MSAAASVKEYSRSAEVLASGAKPARCVFWGAGRGAWRTGRTQQQRPPHRRVSLHQSQGARTHHQTWQQHTRTLLPTESGACTAGNAAAAMCQHVPCIWIHLLAALTNARSVVLFCCCPCAPAQHTHHRPPTRTCGTAPHHQHHAIWLGPAPQLFHNGAVVTCRGTEDTSRVQQGLGDVISSSL